MTDPVVAIDTITPRTEPGSGLLTPLLKTIHHLAVAHAAVVFRGATDATNWNAPVPLIQSELSAAASHAADIDVSDSNPSASLLQLLSTPTRVAIELWKNDLRATIDGTNWSAETFLFDPLRLALEARIAGAWQLTARLDRELTGLSAMQSDPGQRP